MKLDILIIRIGFIPLIVLGGYLLNPLALRRLDLSGLRRKMRPLFSALLAQLLRFSSSVLKCVFASNFENADRRGRRFDFGNHRRIFDRNAH